MVHRRRTASRTTPSRPRSRSAAVRRRSARNTATRSSTTRGGTVRRRGGSRSRRGTAASFGSVFGLLLVWVLVAAPWWVKGIALLVAAGLAVGYPVVTGGRALDPDQAADQISTPDPADRSAPPTEGTLR